MTLEEALVEVYESTDEQSDLDIYSGGVVSLTTAGSVKIKAWLERAQNTISVWKFPGGRRLRFRFMQDTMLAATAPVTYKIDSGGTFPGSTIDVISSPAISSDSLRDAVALFADGTLMEIVTNTGNALAMAGEVATDPADENLVIMSRSLVVTPPGSKRLIQVTGVYDLEQDLVLERAGDRDRLWTVELAQPSSYKPVPGGIMFDSVWNEAKFYRIAFQRWPVMPTTLAGTFEVPLALHDAVVEYAKYTANMRIGKTESAQMAWARVQSILASVRQEADLEEDLVDRTFEVTSWQ